MKFKNRSDRKVVVFGEGTAENLAPGAGHALDVDLGSGYLDVYIYKYSSEFLIEIHLLYCV